MSSTPIVSFQDSVSNFAKLSILTPISEWLRLEKNIDVSIDELLDVLRIPKVHKSPSSFSSTTPVTPTFPPHLVGAQKAVISKRKKVEDNPDAPKCKYEFKKNEKKGQLCGKVCEEGTEFCKEHNKRASKAATSAKAVSKTTNVVNQVGFTTTPAKKEKTVLNLQKTDKEGVFLHTQNNFLVRTDLDESGNTMYVAFSVQEEEGTRPLTESEKQIALSCGFVFPTDAPKQVQSKLNIVKKSPKNDIPDIPDLE